MELKFKDDPIKYEWEVKYLDKSDMITTTYIEGYSERQVRYRFNRFHRNENCNIISVEKFREIPPKDGKQLTLDI